MYKQTYTYGTSGSTITYGNVTSVPGIGTSTYTGTRIYNNPQILINKESQTPATLPSSQMQSEFSSNFQKLSAESKLLIEQLVKEIQKNEELKKLELKKLEEKLELNQSKTKQSEKLHHIFHTVTIDSNSNATIEINADKFGACKPITCTMYVSDYETPIRNIAIDGIKIQQNRQEKFVEIMNVTVMGCPQLVNFDGVTVAGNRGISKFYTKDKQVDWQVFGASTGQGLQFSVRNPFNTKLSISIGLQVLPADTSLIGRT